jgi:hypothetical protein
VSRTENRAMKLLRIRHKASFEERLAGEAKRLKEQAEMIPRGNDREAILLRARQAETAAHMNDWLTSLGLVPPK